MGGWNFDFSGLNPLLQGMTSRNFAAMDERAARQPMLDAQADRAYREWLQNNAQKRDIALKSSEREQKGFDAAQALQGRMEKQAENERAYATEKERASLQASHAAARAMSAQYGGNYGNGAGVTRDFYTYGPYAGPRGRELRGGGGGAQFAGNPDQERSDQRFADMRARAPFTLG